MRRLPSPLVILVGCLDSALAGIPPAESTCHLFQRLSVCLWRGNANCWLDRMPAWVDGVVLVCVFVCVCVCGYIKLIKK